MVFCLVLLLELFRFLRKSDFNRKLGENLKKSKIYSKSNVILRSEIKSSISSTPTLNLIRESTTPVFSLSFLV
jgi:hypothetical protein